jgi:hypothetical protein
MYLNTNKIYYVTTPISQRNVTEALLGNVKHQHQAATYAHNSTEIAGVVFFRQSAGNKAIYRQPAS